VDLGDQGAGVDYGLVDVKDCPITGAKLPLVVSSHGTAGWFGGHHDTAAALADAGFVVAAINHSGDNGNDRSKSDDLSVLGSRPADIVFFRTNRPAPVLAPSLHSLQVLTR
jgi:predicted dienelactone hydrolase